MSFWSAVAIALAGTGAGIINTIVGSGTLITFPTLLFFGVNPLVANVSNNIGLVAGGVTGAWGYRHELDGQARTLRRLMPLSFVGSVVGRRPAARPAGRGVPGHRAGPHPHRAGPRRRRSAHPGARSHPARDGRPSRAGTRPAMARGVFVAGVYGGYFGAAQGVLLMGLLSALSLEPLQRLNGYKNVLALVVNVVAAVVFVLFAREHIDWLVVAAHRGRAFVGGMIGARVGRRIPPNVLRALIIVIGLVAIVKLVWFP